jgi:hypothetical protein
MTVNRFFPFLIAMAMLGQCQLSYAQVLGKTVYSESSAGIGLQIWEVKAADDTPMRQFVQVGFQSAWPLGQPRKTSDLLIFVQPNSAGALEQKISTLSKKKQSLIRTQVIEALDAMTSGQVNGQEVVVSPAAYSILSEYAGPAASTAAILHSHLNSKNLKTESTAYRLGKSVMEDGAGLSTPRIELWCVESVQALDARACVKMEFRMLQLGTVQAIGSAFSVSNIFQITDALAQAVKKNQKLWKKRKFLASDWVQDLNDNPGAVVVGLSLWAGAFVAYGMMSVYGFGVPLALVLLTEAGFRVQNMFAYFHNKKQLRRSALRTQQLAKTIEQMNSGVVNEDVIFLDQKLFNELLEGIQLFTKPLDPNSTIPARQP